jgi:hypothetical protein
MFSFLLSLTLPLFANDCSTYTQADDFEKCLLEENQNELNELREEERIRKKRREIHPLSPNSPSFENLRFPFEDQWENYHPSTRGLEYGYGDNIYSLIKTNIGLNYNHNLGHGLLLNLDLKKALLFSSQNLRRDFKSETITYELFPFQVEFYYNTNKQEFNFNLLDMNAMEFTFLAHFKNKNDPDNSFLFSSYGHQFFPIQFDGNGKSGLPQEVFLAGLYAFTYGRAYANATSFTHGFNFTFIPLAGIGIAKNNSSQNFEETGSSARLNGFYNINTNYEYLQFIELNAETQTIIGSSGKLFLRASPKALFHVSDRFVPGISYHGTYLNELTNDKKPGQFAQGIQLDLNFNF